MKFSLSVSDWTLAREILGILVLENCGLVRKKAVPPLYSSGVVYRRPKMEVDGSQRFLTCAETFAAKEGSCPELAAWRAAELRVWGDPRIGVSPCKVGPKGCIAHPPVRRPNDGRIVSGCPSIKVYRRPEFPGIYHCEVRLPNGDAEDQSRFLGMGNTRE